MPTFGMRFVYFPIQLTEQEMRVARCRAEAAMRERELARKFAAKKKLLNKRFKEDSTLMEASVEPVEANATHVLDEVQLHSEDVPVADGSSSTTGLDEVLVPVLHKETTKEDAVLCDEVDLVRRSLHIADRFKDRLAGSGDCFLHYLEGHHSVKILRDQRKGRWHIKGHRDNVISCYTSIQELIAKWRRREAVDE